MPKHAADPSSFVTPATCRVCSQKTDLETLSKFRSDAVKLSAQISFVSLGDPSAPIRNVGGQDNSGSCKSKTLQHPRTIACRRVSYMYICTRTIRSFLLLLSPPCVPRTALRTLSPATTYHLESLGPEAPCS